MAAPAVNKMDDRCLRKLKDTPRKWCPLAVQRLKALEYLPNELSEEEEAKLPGCAFAVHSQMANYCFFKYIKDIAPNKPLSDTEIAHLLTISVETIQKTEKKALQKLKDSSEFVEVTKHCSEDKILDDEDYVPLPNI